MRLISASNHRLWNTRDQYWQGSVNTICCHGQSGTRLSRYCIHCAPAFTPQCGQERLLHRKQAFLCGNSPVRNNTTVCNPSVWSAGHDFCHRLNHHRTHRPFRLLLQPVKPAVSLLKNIGKTGKHQKGGVTPSGQ